MAKDVITKPLVELNKPKKSCKDICAEFELVINSLDCLSDCYFSIVDATGKIVFISKEFEKFDGYKTSDILGRNVLDVYNLGEQNSVHMIAIHERRIMKNTLLRYSAANGKIVELIMDIYPVFSEQEVIGSVAISRDTSKIKELTDKLSQLQKALYHQMQKTNNNGTQFCFDDIIGSGERLQRVINNAKKMASSESRIMILGETGTGKELFAQSIHNFSSRAAEPFIAVNCSAIPDTLLESILFGTTKGAFTGAMDKAGLFEEAKNGTLFLDELNSMSIVLQAKLLRALETNRIRRVGGNKEIPVNPRIISAMNIDPIEAIETEKLRSDFYYRLAVVTLDIPPLRDRKEDITTLSWCYIKKYNKILGRKIDKISDEVVQMMESYNWSGNVRELSHCIEHAMNIIDPNDTSLQARHLPPFLQDKTLKKNIPPINVSKFNDYKQMMQQVEKDILTEALKRNNGNINQTAKEFNLSRQCLHYKLKRLDIDVQHEIHIE
ncbi:sigma-54-dependent Fis family transcriptional regulator [Schinkia azotoformans]|uniref:Sigma-54 dependent transcriptional regulator n=1 Tax=Schinkia azotoformans LMG 9581 TaxID=1131731 RepID=K6DI12_SCHAZ|nr:sigma-54-dependent Fis family transcriptional regulator [Schinkia azotoformans]EKN67939.1 sigma-54 dependent transcriptional regulator [Schinkia azotoformans LMG 9581]MEC1637041.1 sigma-54-dependent Fis family transcriptional regulator [Schinkia azotoformans]MEC1722139.1 sigma-54-dependent Fis family transcriptional regulator [Schinkia azotoformans]MEC1946993.1 sigma-54-dependent Fis family transcriptional regulator [Schinkia azotoformans]MED4412499.1 sigma-54-dependent Fis family transcrip